MLKNGLADYARWRIANEKARIDTDAGLGIEFRATGQESAPDCRRINP